MKIEIKIPERYTLGGDWVSSDNSVFVFSPVDGTMEVRIETPDEQTFFLNLRDLQRVMTRLDLLINPGVPKAEPKQDITGGAE
jgi:hypothetical protein